MSNKLAGNRSGIAEVAVEFKVSFNYLVIAILAIPCCAKLRLLGPLFVHLVFEWRLLRQCLIDAVAAMSVGLFALILFGALQATLHPAAGIYFQTFNWPANNRIFNIMLVHFFNSLLKCFFGRFT